MRQREYGSLEMELNACIYPAACEGPCCSCGKDIKAGEPVYEVRGMRLAGDRVRGAWELERREMLCLACRDAWDDLCDMGFIPCAGENLQEEAWRLKEAIM